MSRGVWAILSISFIFSCVSLEAQVSKEYVITLGRRGDIEFVDPLTLKTIGSIAVDVPPHSTGLNGVFANPDGRTIYVEGTVGALDGAGCCWLYSVDLATLETKVVAGIWGTRSRRRFISVGPSSMQPIPTIAATRAQTLEGDQWQLSPDGQWGFGLRNGPALDLYDTVRGEIVRSFGTPDLDEPLWSSGTWVGSYFYVYGTYAESGRVWTLSPESKKLDDGIPVPEPTAAPGCSEGRLMKIISAGDRLLLYEIFGAKIDRRDRCDEVPGGAWILEPSTGQLARLVASNLHFGQLVPNRSGSEIYGITSEAPNTQAPAHLLRIDGRTGDVLQSRSLDSDYWWVAFASLRTVPSGNVSLSLTANDSR